MRPNQVEGKWYINNQSNPTYITVQQSNSTYIKVQPGCIKRISVLSNDKPLSISVILTMTSAKALYVCAN